MKKKRLWAPCPRCGDDNTFLLTPSGPRPCKRCTQYCAIVREGSRLRVIKTKKTGKHRTYKSPPRGRSGGVRGKRSHGKSRPSHVEREFGKRR